MLEVHTKGKGVCGVYTYEIAETRSRRSRARPAASTSTPLHHGRDRNRCRTSSNICLNDAFQRAREEAPRVHHRRALAARAARYAARCVEMLKACGADLARLRTRAQGVHRPASTPRLRGEEEDEPPTCSRRWAFSGCCSAPCSTCSRAARKEVTPANVLVAIFGEKQSQAVYLLGLQDVARLDVVNFVSHGVPKIQEAKPERRRRQRRGRARRRSEPTRALYVESQRARRGRQDRSADRPAARDRAHRADPLPPPQEQPAVRRRSRRRQDRARGGARAVHRRGQGARRAAPTARSTRSTWAR